MSEIQLDRSWRALFEPGATTAYGFDRIPRPLSPSGAFDPALAALAAESARLAYQGAAPVRAAALGLGSALGLREVAMLETTVTSCLVLVAEALPLTIVAFRGTDEPGDWLTNLQALISHWKPGGFAHRGFKRAWYSIGAEIATTLKGLPRPRVVCGHSLGGALAVLEASQRGADALYTIGAPRPGTEGLHATIASVPTFRVVNDHDPVPELPTAGPPFFFQHDGALTHLDADGQPGRSAPTLGDRARGLRDILRNRAAWSDLTANAPQALADHAPVNYSAKLLRLAQR